MTNTTEALGRIHIKAQKKFLEVHDKLQAIRDGFLADPMGTLTNYRLFELAAEHEGYGMIIEYLNKMPDDLPEAAYAELRKHALNEVIRISRENPSSTSKMHNEADHARAQFWARQLDGALGLLVAHDLKDVDL